MKLSLNVEVCRDVSKTFPRLSSENKVMFNRPSLFLWSMRAKKQNILCLANNVSQEVQEAVYKCVKVGEADKLKMKMS